MTPRSDGARRRGLGEILGLGGILATLMLTMASTMLIPVAARAGAAGFITLLSPTTVADSGLLDKILPTFEARAGVTVRVHAAAPDRILALARRGVGDVALIETDANAASRSPTANFDAPRPVMFTDWIMVGPVADPARIRGMASIIDALKQLTAAGQRIVSRRDGGRLHRAEITFWREAGINPAIEIDLTQIPTLGDSETALTLAARRGAYVLTGRAAWLRFGDRNRLAPMVEGDPRLERELSALVITGGERRQKRARNARALADWLASRLGQAAIATFTISDQPVYRPTRVLPGE